MAGERIAELGLQLELAGNAEATQSVISTVIDLQDQLDRVIDNLRGSDHDAFTQLVARMTTQAAATAAELREDKQDKQDKQPYQPKQKGKK